MEEVSIYWDGPFNIIELERKENKMGIDEYKDYGIYQIYGSHPVYGNDVLLYIGKAEKQTFFTRIKQEKHWWYNQDSDNVVIYFGRMIGETPSEDTWNKMISKAEALLIYAHRPAHNSSNINSINVSDLSNMHILNWGSHKSLLPEVSSKRVLDEVKDRCEDYFSLDKI